MACGWESLPSPGFPSLAAHRMLAHHMFGLHRAFSKIFSWKSVWQQQIISLHNSSCNSKATTIKTHGNQNFYQWNFRASGKSLSFTSPFSMHANASPSTCSRRNLRTKQTILQSKIFSWSIDEKLTCLPWLCPASIFSRCQPLAPRLNLPIFAWSPWLLPTQSKVAGLTNSSLYFGSTYHSLVLQICSRFPYPRGALRHMWLTLGRIGKCNFITVNLSNYFCCSHDTPIKFRKCKFRYREKWTEVSHPCS